MIDYKRFQFAAAPMTAVDWFIRASQLAGLGPGFSYTAHTPFSSTKSQSIRVTLVRNPCDWLRRCFLSLQQGPITCNHVGVLSQLNTESFDAFVHDYTSRCPGAVGRMFLQYKADSCIRVEDLPAAFNELMATVGCPFTRYRSLAFHRVPMPVNSRLRSIILNAENEMAEYYDYW